jgi:GMP synthase (glutamine-hydrolysing)
MRLHYFQHVPFEGLASIERWATSKEHTLTATKFYENNRLPEIEAIDWLIVLGGPMNIYEEDKYPWLTTEKTFIRKAIESDKTVIGICLGAQLITDVLGAKVYLGKYKEIGWFPISLTQRAQQSNIFGFLPEQFNVFHWHGDTFDLPAGAVHLARSEACENQAFIYNGRVLGLQFHLESTEQSVQQIVQNCKTEIVQAEYIQSADEILAVKGQNYSQINNAMFGILDRLPK